MIETMCLSLAGMEARIHNHYVRNYMLHMPFTHRSTLTMNTNRFIEGGVRRNAFKTENIFKRGLSILRFKFD